MSKHLSLGHMGLFLYLTCPNIFPKNIWVYFYIWYVQTKNRQTKYIDDVEFTELKNRQTKYIDDVEFTVLKNRQTKYIDDVELTVKNLRNNVVVFPLSAAGGKVSVKIQRTEEDGWTN